METVLYVIGIVMIVFFIFHLIKEPFLDILSYIRDFFIMAVLGLVIGVILRLIFGAVLPFCTAGIVAGLVFEVVCIIFRRGRNPILEWDMFINA